MSNLLSRRKFLSNAGAAATLPTQLRGSPSSSDSLANSSSDPPVSPDRIVDMHVIATRKPQFTEVDPVTLDSLRVQSPFCAMGL